MRETPPVTAIRRIGVNGSRKWPTVAAATEAALDKLDGEIIAEVDAAYEAADAAPQPPPEARFKNILVGE